MDVHVYFAFVVAATIMIALPGPSVLLTVAHSISFGWQRALCTVAGATMGIAVQLIVAAIGLTSLLNVVAEAFEWLRWAGAIYLVYLGIKQWRSAKEPLAFDTSSVSKTNLFVQGLIITIPNPKSLIFIAAFLPQFIDTAQPLGLQFVLIVPTFLVITFTVTSVWALVAGNVRGFLQSRRAFQSVLRTAGGLMIIAGMGLALSRRGN
jgi:threonine/homoserine/homoserine lactone efflux protein